MNGKNKGFLLALAFVGLTTVSLNVGLKPAHAQNAPTQGQQQHQQEGTHNKKSYSHQAAQGQPSGETLEPLKHYNKHSKNVKPNVPTLDGEKERRWNQIKLTDAQKAQIKQIEDSSRQQIDTIYTPQQKEQLRTAQQQHQKPNLNLSAEQTAQLKAIHQNVEKQIQAVFTPEQLQQLQTNSSKEAQNHQDKDSK
jgi:Spy/CpxP family protein refolding chaperone